MPARAISSLGMFGKSVKIDGAYQDGMTGARLGMVVDCTAKMKGPTEIFAVPVRLTLSEANGTKPLVEFE